MLRILLSVVLLLTQTGCTVIGYHYGSKLDERKSRNSEVNLSSARAPIRSGDLVSVTLVDGTVHTGEVISVEWGRQLNIETGTTTSGDPDIVSCRWKNVRRLDKLVKPSKLNRPSYMILGFAVDALATFLIIEAAGGSKPTPVQAGYEE